ncbi:hypothetical protein VPH35_086176 [Triticum aestivum]|uniref:protein SPT2 homolog n=1 Tax=Triticum aestivum TaxID=4565 RepID=UPI0001BA3AB4|nr:protein SPT2 homolog [Triticum aestivum]
MAEKRKADDNLNGTRHPAARTEPTAGDEVAGTSAQASGPTANPTGDGIAGTSQALAGLTAATTGSAGGSSQSGGAARGRGAGGGAGYRGFSQSQPHRRAPQMPSQGMLRQPRGNPAVGSAPFPYHAPTGNGSLSGQSQSQIGGPRQTGTGQPLGHSGSGGPSSAISSASAPGAPVSVNPLVRACPRCNRPTIVFLGLSPLCADCLSTFVISYVLPRHPEIHYGGARATQGQGISNSHQRQPSSAALPRARAAVGPLRRAPTDGWWNNCLALTREVLGSTPLCQVCYNRLFVAGDVPPQHAQTGGHVLPNPVPSYAGVPLGPVPASEQQYRAEAIRPSSSSSSAVGSGPICQACGHPFGTGNRACRFWRLHGPPPPPPPPGLG